jgi:hypothetical protein
MWLPNAPGETDPIDVIDAEPLHEQRDAGIERGLGELNGAHVVLRDLHLDRADWHRPCCSAVRARCST